MSVKVKNSGKLVIIALILGGLFAAKVFWWDNRPQDAKESREIGKVMLPDAPEASLKGNATMLELPSDKVSVNGGTKIQWKIMAWNS